MEKKYNWEYIYRGDIYRMEKGKGVLEEKDIDVAYMEDEHAWARINDILDCLYPDLLMIKKKMMQFTIVPLPNLTLH